MNNLMRNLGFLKNNMRELILNSFCEQSTEFSMFFK